MYIVFEKDGFQYVADKGDVLKLQKIDVPEGEKIIIDKVLLLKDNDNVEIGKPYIEGVKLEAEVVEHGHDPTIIVYKYKRRKNYRRKKGHRQLYTRVKITNILREE